MNFTFYLVDETLMPAVGAASTTPEVLTELMRQRGGRWSTVDAKAEEFEETFETLDPFTGGKGFIPMLAASGAIKFLPVGYPHPWSLGYFEASLVPALAGALRIQSAEVSQAIEGKNDGTQNVYDAFVAALADAQERNMAVAIVFEG